MPEIEGIHFQEEGSGFPVILVHGFCETHEIWKSFSKALANEYRVISIDLPGFGQSKLLRAPFSISNVAIKIHNFLQALHISSCVAIGHSLGGYITLAMVEKQPERFRAFCLFHSTAYPDSEEKKNSRNKVIEFVTANGVAPFIESFIPPLFYDQTNPHIEEAVRIGLKTPQNTLITYVAAMRDRPDRTHVVRDFNGPVLFIAGEKDGVVSQEAIHSQSRLASNPTVYLATGVAHMGMFEDPAGTIGQTKAFLTMAGCGLIQ
jgi:pimeloyl-ACP methyl ester carboxylesterase